MPPPAVPQPPWPEQADGDGPSLFLNVPRSAPDPADPSSWTASLSADGSPGQEQLSEFTGDPLADADQDGAWCFQAYLPVECAHGWEVQRVYSPWRTLLTGSLLAVIF